MKSLLPNQEALEAYDQVELDENEIEAALERARKDKYFEQRRIAYRDSLLADMTPPKFTSEQMLEAYGNRYAIDEDNSQVVADLCHYFADDKRFSGDLARGILIYGAVGVGKTSLMNFFFKNQKLSFIMTSCRQVETAYATDGNDGLQKYFINRSTIASNSDPFGHRELGYCFDDLGTEPPVTKYYGTDKAAMTEVILNRYDFLLPYASTHLTTNLGAEDIKNRYGSRAADRMREMFNFIQYKSTRSRRTTTTPS